MWVGGRLKWSSSPSRLEAKISIRLTALAFSNLFCHVSFCCCHCCCQIVVDLGGDVDFFICLIHVLVVTLYLAIFFSIPFGECVLKICHHFKPFANSLISPLSWCVNRSGSEPKHGRKSSPPVVIQTLAPLSLQMQITTSLFSTGWLQRSREWDRAKSRKVWTSSRIWFRFWLCSPSLSLSRIDFIVCQLVWAPYRHPLIINWLWSDRTFSPLATAVNWWSDVCQWCLRWWCLLLCRADFAGIDCSGLVLIVPNLLPICCLCVPASKSH